MYIRLIAFVGYDGSGLGKRMSFQVLNVDSNNVLETKSPFRKG